MTTRIHPSRLCSAVLLLTLLSLPMAAKAIPMNCGTGGASTPVTDADATPQAQKSINRLTRGAKNLRTQVMAQREGRAAGSGSPNGLQSLGCAPNRS